MPKVRERRKTGAGGGEQGKETGEERRAKGAVTCREERWPSAGAWDQRTEDTNGWQATAATEGKSHTRAPCAGAERRRAHPEGTTPKPQQHRQVPSVPSQCCRRRGAEGMWLLRRGNGGVGGTSASRHDRPRTTSTASIDALHRVPWQRGSAKGLPLPLGRAADTPPGQSDPHTARFALGRTRTSSRILVPVYCTQSTDR